MNHLDEARRLYRAGDFSAAAAMCRKALRKGPAPAAKALLADCLFSQGVMLLFAGLFDDAEKLFHQALEQNPKHADALINLGTNADNRGDLEASKDFYERAVGIEPGRIVALENLARAYSQLDRTGDAERTLQRLSALRPGDGIYPFQRASLIASIVPDAAYPAAIRQRMREQFSAIIASGIAIDHPERMFSMYFYLSYHGLPNRDINRLRAQTLLSANPALAWRAPHVAEAKAGATSPHTRVRIGIASRFFRDHSIGNTSVGLVEQLDRERFEVVVIHIGAAAHDRMRARIDAAADRVVHVKDQDLQQAREAIAELRLDVLFWQDIGMESFSYFLAFARLAPVQLTSYGHPDTTGIPNIDYFMSSALFEPEDGDAHYSEKLYRLPDVGNLSYYHRPEKPPAATRETFGLDAGEHLYFCPQTLFKFHPDMDGIFARIVALDALARIVLIEPKERNMRDALERRMYAAHPALGGRLHFVKALPRPQYLALMGCMDAMLDTVHFNGMNTNLEAFTMGVPVVTLPGAFQRARHTLGMYRAMGFMELVAADAADYAAKAVRVATDPAYRRHCQERIAASSGVLFESRRFVRECETAILEMMANR